MDVSLFRANYTNSSPPYRIRVGEFAIDFRAKNAPIYIFGTRLNVGLTLSTEEFKSRDGTVWGVDGNGKHVAYSPYFSIYNFVEGRVNGQKTTYLLIRVEN
ncbi:MAG: hypothetical protein CV045_02900 [Cyanobacteria bacterium M5B4]|nr:MAG: hypothetical protein CV045_02900 [Cyanobacteria bacterium M5B4]